jgi:hypothetical protein
VLRPFALGYHTGVIFETLGIVLGLATAPPLPPGTRLPGTLAGNVVILTPEDARHRRLRVLVDSGGYDLIDAATADALGLQRSPIELGGKPRFTVPFPEWMRASVPSPETAWLIARDGVLREGFAPELDATLGPSWLLDNTITVDYPDGTIELARPDEAGTAVPLTVGVGRAALPSLPPSGLATIDVSVAGSPLTLLLDTGATARVLPAALTLMPDAAPVRQVCLVESSLLAAWHREHPDWRYVDAAFDVAGDAPAAPAILVPGLRIGDLLASPTWFVARRDASTFAAVSKQMGKTVSGDLGGDALRRWRVTFDLKNERLLLR